MISILRDSLLCYNAYVQIIILKLKASQTICVSTSARGREEFLLRSDFERARKPYPSNRGKAVSRDGKHAGASLAFCWGFGLVVCAAFGLASFLMISAGHFSFSTPSGVEAAWGGIEGEGNLTAVNLIKVEVTDLEQKPGAELYAKVPSDMTNMNKLEEFGPVPKYLSDYENIILNMQYKATTYMERVY